MPEALAIDPSKTIMHYKGGTSPPKDPAMWAALITDLVAGCVDRYGITEVRSWRFEVWNERAWRARKHRATERVAPLATENTEPYSTTPKLGRGSFVLTPLFRSKRLRVLVPAERSVPG